MIAAPPVTGATTCLLFAVLMTGAGPGISIVAAADKPGEIVRFAEIGLSIHPLGDGIWRHVSTTVMESGRPIPANGLIVTSAGKAILIDTGWNAEQTGAILDWIERDLMLEPIGVVATHFHADCVGGIEAAIARGLNSWAYSGTATLAKQEGLRAPQTLFDDFLTIAVGYRRVELFYPGAGHAPDNIVASVPDRGLLFGGCLVKSAKAESIGYIGNADLASWPGSIVAVRARFPEATLIVPGHGDPGSAELYENTLRLLKEAQP